MDLRDLPSTDALAAEMADEYPAVPRAVVVDVVRRAIDAARTSIRDGSAADPTDAARSRLDDLDTARPRTVINATGVLLHTNLGRAPLHHDAVAALGELAARPANVELDVRTGRRSSRHTYLGSLIPPATGAEAGFAVNNNAGALLLALASVAGDGGHVAVSRGELIEIGGSFRLPDLMRSSGAHLVEVGTTNRTRIGDFERVAGSVDAILKVHPSNYRIHGYHEDAEADALAQLARAHGIPFIFDVGSGLLDAEAPWVGDGPRDWFADEPGVRQAVAGGADLVVFSGDKLLGGPQAGLVVGTAVAVDRARRHPIARAVRTDGGTIAALAATLDLYLGRRVLEIPFWRMACASVAEIERRSRVAVGDLASASMHDGASVPGAGSVPGATIPTRVVRIDGDADRVWHGLASAPPRPVIGTRRDGAVYLDLRSVLPEDDHDLRLALRSVLA